MTTEPQQRRMTQQSRRQLEAADTVTVRAQRGGGYAIELFKINRDKNCMDYVSTVCAADGPMLYPAPSAAVRAIRRIRPDLPDEEIPLVHDVRKAPPQSAISSDVERLLERLYHIQSHQASFIRCLENDKQDRHAFHAKALLTSLDGLESELRDMLTRCR